MNTDALGTIRETGEGNQHEGLSWDVAELQVTDLARAVDFWTRVLGLGIRQQDGSTAELGTRKKTLIVLLAGALRPVRREHLGLYHVAIGVPDQAEFSRILARLIKTGVPVSPTDHLLSKSIYLSDPDGLGIEIVYETPERFGRFGDLSRGLAMYDIDGNPHSGREPLDVQAELRHARGADLGAPLSDEASLAHLHLQIPALDSATQWFEGIGFSRSLMIPGFGFADMNFGGRSLHRLGLNIWAGQNLSPAPPFMARLTGYTLHVHDPAIMAKARGLLKTSGTKLTGFDPSGTEMSLIPAYQVTNL
ncbi:VOC family protein [uncultured Roseibium sp.]|uniref:VOC family protein n=1 Tax=uncultured Roseibium sp. TaxID=1936171 RepID=UPI002624A8BE|nr:VOC family protein [uncultured Roseibium sp.]